MRDSGIGSIIGWIEKAKGGRMPQYKQAYLQRAINELERGYSDITTLIDMGIPKKVIIDEDAGYFECTNCIANGDTDSAWMFTERGEYTYCPRCGHRLDWDDK